MVLQSSIYIHKQALKANLVKTPLTLALTAYYSQTGSMTHFFKFFFYCDVLVSLITYNFMQFKTKTGCPCEGGSKSLRHRRQTLLKIMSVL